MCVVNGYPQNVISYRVDTCALLSEIIQVLAFIRSRISSASVVSSSSLFEARRSRRRDSHSPEIRSVLANAGSLYGIFASLQRALRATDYRTRVALRESSVPPKAVVLIVHVQRRIATQQKEIRHDYSASLGIVHRPLCVHLYPTFV